MPYKVDQIEYAGFHHYRAGDRRIIIATFDGDSDIYAVDTGIHFAVAVDSIKRMYRADYDREPEVIVCYNCDDIPASPLKPAFDRIAMIIRGAGFPGKSDRDIINECADVVAGRACDDSPRITPIGHHRIAAMEALTPRPDDSSALDGVH